MDLLRERIRPLYLRYLAAAFGSACISSVYGLVDMAMVGQYHGPPGTAVMSVVMPVFNIIYSLGLLMGIGGCVLYGAEKGRRETGRENEFFTTALLGTAVLAAAAWAGILLFEEPLLRLFGAEETLLPLTKAYLRPIEAVIPVFVFNQVLAAFLRNDNAPGLATAAVLGGGLLNVAGDYFLVFTLDMGISGAGLATAAGACTTLLILLTHFFSKSNGLRLTRVSRPAAKARGILATGFSTFFIDLSVGIITMLFNRQIVRYLGTDALAVYGLIINVGMFVQCCAYSVGQAAQPILSINFGAERWDRIQETLRYALGTAALLGILWTALIVAVPNGFVQLFMKPTRAVLQIAPAILRCYGSSFLLLPLNVFSTYYFQSLGKPAVSLTVSLGRGLAVSGALILLLPAAAGADAIWLAMPVTELAVAAFVALLMLRYAKRRPGRAAE